MSIASLFRSVFFNCQGEEVGGCGGQRDGSAGGPIQCIGEEKAQGCEEDSQDAGEGHHPWKVVGEARGDGRWQREHGDDEDGADDLDE